MTYDPRAETSELFKQAILKTFDFRGRARRAELLSYYLGSFFAGVAILAVLQFASLDSDGVLFDRRLPLARILQFAIAIPMISLLARRLHDQGRTGWWSAVPSGLFIVAGSYELATGRQLEDLFHPALWAAIVLSILAGVLYIAFAPGQQGDNAYGPDPHYDEPLTATE